MVFRRAWSRDETCRGSCVGHGRGTRPAAVLARSRQSSAGPSGRGARGSESSHGFRCAPPVATCLRPFGTVYHMGVSRTRRARSRNETCHGSCVGHGRGASPAIWVAMVCVTRKCDIRVSREPGPLLRAELRRRRCALQPRVAAQRLPWDHDYIKDQPQRGSGVVQPTSGLVFEKARCPRVALKRLRRFVYPGLCC